MIRGCTRLTPKHPYANFQAFEAALDLEIIQQDNKAAKPVKVATVEDWASDPDLDTDELNPTALAAGLDLAAGTATIMDTL